MIGQWWRYRAAVTSRRKALLPLGNFENRPYLPFSFS
jgi:hypothetical protein